MGIDGIHGQYSQNSSSYMMHWENYMRQYGMTTSGGGSSFLQSLANIPFSQSSVTQSLADVMTRSLFPSGGFALPSIPGQSFPGGAQQALDTLNTTLSGPAGNVMNDAKNKLLEAVNGPSGVNLSSLKDVATNFATKAKDFLPQLKNLFNGVLGKIAKFIPGLSLAMAVINLGVLALKKPPATQEEWLKAAGALALGGIACIPGIGTAASVALGSLSCLVSGSQLVENVPGVLKDAFGGSGSPELPAPPVASLDALQKSSNEDLADEALATGAATVRA